MLATIITYNTAAILSCMTLLPRHDQTDNCKKQAKGNGSYLAPSGYVTRECSRWQFAFDYFERGGLPF